MSLVNTRMLIEHTGTDNFQPALSSVFSQEAASLALFSLDHAPIDSVENGQSSLDP